MNEKPHETMRRAALRMRMPRAAAPAPAPEVGGPLADLLDHTARLVEGNQGRFGGTQSSILVHALALACLGESGVPR